MGWPAVPQILSVPPSLGPVLEWMELFHSLKAPHCNEAPGFSFSVLVPSSQQDSGLYVQDF